MTSNSKKKIDTKLTISVLIACHNRKLKTIRCLESLYAAKPSNWDLNVYLVDDGSTDGTSDAVRLFDPAIQIIMGSGDWYWAHSMYQAEMKISRQHDAILWINDDIVLEIDSLISLDHESRSHPDSILVGQFKSIVDGKLTYGGYIKYDRHPFHLKRVYANKKSEPIDTFNGNLVFIPVGVSKLVGLIDGEFDHAYADIDYGLRARAAGVKMNVIPGFVGTCEKNPSQEYRNIVEGLKGLLSIKSSPIRSQIRFLRRHGGRFWWIFLLTPFIKLFLRSIIGFFQRRIFKRQ